MIKRKAPGSFALPFGPKPQLGEQFLVNISRPNALLADEFAANSVISTGIGSAFEGCTNVLHTFDELELQKITPKSATFVRGEIWAQFSDTPGRRIQVVVLDCTRDPHGNNNFEGQQPQLLLARELKDISGTLFRDHPQPIFWVINLAFDESELSVRNIEFELRWPVEAKMRYLHEMIPMIVSMVCKLNEEHMKEDWRNRRMALSGGRDPLATENLDILQMEELDGLPTGLLGKWTQVIIVVGYERDLEDTGRIAKLYNEFLRRRAVPYLLEFCEDRKADFSEKALVYSNVDIIYFDIDSLLKGSMNMGALSEYFVSLYDPHCTNGVLLTPDLSALTKVLDTDVSSLTKVTPPVFTENAVTDAYDVTVIMFGDEVHACEVQAPESIPIDMKSPYIVCTGSQTVISKPTERVVRDIIRQYQSSHEHDDLAHLCVGMLKKLLSPTGYGSIKLNQRQLASLLGVHASNLSKALRSPGSILFASELGRAVLDLSARMFLDSRTFLYQFPAEVVDKIDFNRGDQSNVKQRRLTYFFGEASNETVSRVPTISLKRACDLTFGKHKEMEEALNLYAQDSQPQSLRSRSERLIIANNLWKIGHDISPTNTTAVVPPMDPKFLLGMMGLDDNGVQGRDRGALRTYWTTSAIPFRIKGCDAERKKPTPDPGKYCGLSQNMANRRNNDMRNICPHCNRRVVLSGNLSESSL